MDTTPQVVVNVQSYGDFEIPNTDTIMIAPSGMSPGEVSTQVAAVTKLHRETNNSKKLINELKLLGYQRVAIIDAVVGGDL